MMSILSKCIHSNAVYGAITKEKRHQEDTPAVSCEVTDEAVFTGYEENNLVAVCKTKSAVADA